MTLTLTGLPHRPTWPRILALLLAGRRSSPAARGAPRAADRRDAADARRGSSMRDRDKLFAELAALEAQRRKGTIDAPALRRRGGPSW